MRSDWFSKDDLAWLRGSTSDQISTVLILDRVCVLHNVTFKLKTFVPSSYAAMKLFESEVDLTVLIYQDHTLSTS